MTNITIIVWQQDFCFRNFSAQTEAKVATRSRNRSKSAICLGKLLVVAMLFFWSGMGSKSKTDFPSSSYFNRSPMTPISFLIQASCCGWTKSKAVLMFRNLAFLVVRYPIPQTSSIWVHFSALMRFSSVSIT